MHSQDGAATFVGAANRCDASPGSKRQKPLGWGQTRDDATTAGPMVRSLRSIYVLVDRSRQQPMPRVSATLSTEPPFSPLASGVFIPCALLILKGRRSVSPCSNVNCLLQR